MRCRSCPPLPEQVRRVTDLLERRWTISILYVSHEGAVRFNEFLQALGTIRANQAARQADIANLEAATQTQDPSQLTIMAELQRINQALLLQLRTLQDANQINANLALQQIVAQKQQQDAMKSAFRDSSGYENYYNANITTTSSGAANLLTQAY